MRPSAALTASLLPYCLSFALTLCRTIYPLLRLSPSSNPTVSELKSSSLAALANDHWAGDGKLKFDGGLVETLYTEHLCRFDATDVAVLEKSGLLERYLWPFYKEDSSPRHAMAILLLLNEKKRGDGATWSIFDDREKDFAALLTRCFSLPSEMPEMRFR